MAAMASVAGGAPVDDEVLRGLAADVAQAVG